MTMKKIDGGCHCGSITYEATVNPDFVVICHCTDCQTLSGSAFRTVVRATKDNFRVLTGDPKIYVKTTERGTKCKQAFCPECGTPIYASDLSESPLFTIRVGTSRQRAELTPKAQIWCRSALNWVNDIGLFTQFSERRPR